MKKLLLTLLTLVLMQNLHAGASNNPVELLSIDNQGRSIFLHNALREIGYVPGEATRYGSFESYTIGGDETGSDYTGAYFAFRVEIFTVSKKYKCEQFISIGNFDSTLTRPVSCNEF